MTLSPATFLYYSGAMTVTDPLEVRCTRCFAAPGNFCPRLLSVQPHAERVRAAAYLDGWNAAIARR